MPRLSTSTTRRHRSSTDSAQHEVQPATTHGKRSGHGTLYTWLLSLLATFLLGTVIVLSIVKSFFGVDWNDVLDSEQVELFSSLPTIPYGTRPPASPSTEITVEKVPRIIHQTWKTTLLPTKWAKLTTQCKALHPDYEYKLWTDESSIEFIKQFYPWFLPTFMNYNLNIQRADVIRYFVLHKYGGVYMDLDIGCRRAMDPLLNFETILPATKPIGISNDLIFAEPNSPFMDSVIHNLIAFDHYYLSDYPTVMFSTGPMFLSAVLSLWNSRSTYADVSSTPLNSRDGSTSHSPFSFLSSSSKNSSATSSLGGDNTLNPFETSDHGHTVRILPKELYGKNVLPELVPDAFFYHYYGSSWHQNDSFIFTFLGNFGKTLMNIAFLVVIVGTAFIVFRKYRRNAASKRVGNLTRSDINTNSDSGYRLALDYDSDIEEGSGRITPSSSLLPLPSGSANASRSASSSRRSRRRQYRRAMAAGARNWLFGGIGGKNNTTIVGGGRRRSASTGAISLPVQSAESGSEDALLYTSSSEDGRDTRRGSLLDRYQAGHSGSQHARRASVWTDDDDLPREVVEGEIVISSSSRIAPPLHRRGSSQPGLPSDDDMHSKTASNNEYLEPPPPYRAPSPLSPTSPSTNNNRSWYSSFFSNASTTSSASIAQLPLFSSSSTNTNTNSSNHSRSTSQDHLAPHNAFVSHSQLQSRSQSPSHSQSQPQDYISHTRNSSLADNEIEERDSDNFSLHSVKARR